MCVCAVSYTHLDVYKRQIYRKETYSDLIIPQESYHPVNYKMAALNSFCYRAINYLENEELKQKELKLSLIHI